MPSKMFTIEEAAEQIRVFAEGTAKHSQNWDNFQEIAKSMLEGAIKAARQKALEEAAAVAGTLAERPYDSEPEFSCATTIEAHIRALTDNSDVFVSTINLNSERATRSGDCRNWTVEDCLKEALQDVIEKKIPADMVYIAFREKNEEDSSATFPSYCAGVTNIECRGLLFKHLTDLNSP